MNIPITGHCSRKAVTALVAPSPLFPDPAHASDETPMQRLFSEWAALYASFTATDEHHRWSDDHWEGHLSALGEIEGRIEAAPVLSLQDLALKHAAMTSFGEITDDRFDRAAAAFLRISRDVGSARVTPTAPRPATSGS